MIQESFQHSSLIFQNTLVLMITGAIRRISNADYQSLSLGKKFLGIIQMQYEN